MDTLHPIMAQALAPFAPPPISTGQLFSSIRSWNQGRPSHSEIAAVLHLMASAVKASGPLSDACSRSVVDQLQELVNEVEQDDANQQEQSA